MTSIIALLSRPELASREDFNNRILTEATRRIADNPALRRVAAFVSDEGIEELAASTGGPGASFDAAMTVSADDLASARALLADGLGHDACHVYRIETRTIKACEATWDVGERTPGLVMVSPVYRADAMSAAEFDDYWRDGHAPLALRHHVGMWDYRQNVVREVLTDGSPPYDGVALLGFPSIEAFTDGLFDSPAGMEVIMNDTRRFLALERSESALMVEYRLTGCALAERGCL